MALTMTVADNFDGTGATATISGSAGGTVEVRYAPVANPTAWVFAGSRVGDGNFGLALAKGYYNAYAKESTTLSFPAYFGVTQTTDALHWRCKEAVYAKVLTLTSLADIPAARMYNQIQPVPELTLYPCLLVTIEGVTPAEVGLLSGKDDWQYPVRVWFGDRQSGALHDRLPKYLSWRQAIEDAFHNKRLAGVPEVNACVVNPEVVIPSPPPVAYQEIVSGLVVRCDTRRVRAA